jgi:hypothetical protein
MHYPRGSPLVHAGTISAVSPTSPAHYAPHYVPKVEPSTLHWTAGVGTTDPATRSPWLIFWLAS